MTDASTALRTAPPATARFTHETGYPELRIQVFLAVRDKDRRILTLRTSDAPDAWALPGEMLRVNESPHDGARRTVATWFKTPLQLWLADCLSYPATGPEDAKWYLIFVYEAEAPEGLQPTDDTLETKFVPAGTPPGPFAYSHKDVFERLPP